MDLREQLQATLGSSYALERELGGGGMSRVFVANERALGRNVVVKVLSPELAQGVSVERFRREIQLAAQLQHPHIVPVHTSGETGGLPFYTMPFVEGASLRSRISRAGPLPIGECINILREVARALAYAHDRGVVHRDIKPDNVLITGGSAVVTDFGIAKALAAAKRSSTSAIDATLTQMGTSLGTPAYMAPEQAAADPETNHRADIYAFGCMAYEMLSGRPPFVNKAPQRLLAAHMAETPQPISDLRPDTPPLLADMVMQCLEKEPDKRPQSASDVVKILESVTTSGGAYPAMPEILLGGRVRLGRALATYAMAFVVIAVLAKAAIVGIGLPTWVFPGTIAIMAIGLPVVLFTAFVHHGAHQAMTMAQTTPGGTPVVHSTMTKLAVRASPWVNWRRTTMGGIVAVTLFMLLVAGYMITRAFGVGPAASLMSAGVLADRDKLLIADFKSPASDTSLGPVVTEAFRSDISQSANINVVQPATVRDVLRRMQRSPDTPLDFALAREIAAREGLKALIDGEVLSLGGGYVIAAKLYASQTGDLLASFRETASDPKEIVPAIDRLSRDVRAKIGESLKSVNAAPPLARVTTPSLDALTKYVQAIRVFQQGTDFDRGVALLDDAVRLDTGFAMAYRKLATELANHAGFETKQLELIQKAYDHRDRLSDAERLLTEGTYWRAGPQPNLTKSLAADEALVELQPDNATALNNVAFTYNLQHMFSRAEPAARRAVAANPKGQPYWTNLLWAEIAQGKTADARAALSQFAANVPGSPNILRFQGVLAWNGGHIDSVESMMSAARKPGTQLPVARIAADWSEAAAFARGRVADGRRWLHEVARIDAAQGVASANFAAAVDEANSIAWFSSDSRRASALLDSLLASGALATLAPLERPYADLARAFARVGRVDRARAMLSAFDSTRRDFALLGDSLLRHRALGEIAMAEHRYDVAAREYAQGGFLRCGICALPEVARALDLAGRPDSAVAVLTPYVNNTTDAYRFLADAYYLADAYKRLGELWEQKGDRQKAAVCYSKFIDLWKNADPELQPKVAEARTRLARLNDAQARR